MKYKTYKFSKKGWEQAKKDNNKTKNNRVMDLVVYSTLLGFTITNMMRSETLFKVIACDGTNRVVKAFVLH